MPNWHSGNVIRMQKPLGMACISWMWLYQNQILNISAKLQTRIISSDGISIDEIYVRYGMLRDSQTTTITHTKKTIQNWKVLANGNNSSSWKKRERTKSRCTTNKYEQISKTSKYEKIAIFARKKLHNEALVVHFLFQVDCVGRQLTLYRLPLFIFEIAFVVSSNDFIG